MHKISISRNTDIVQTPYVTAVLERVKNFHLNNIASNDTIHYLMLFLDEKYRQSVFRRMWSQLVGNSKLKPALQELRQRYGSKLDERLDLIFEQMHVDFDEDVA